MRTDALLLPSVLKSFDAAADAAEELTAAAAGASRSTVTAAVAGKSAMCPLWSGAQSTDSLQTSSAGRDQSLRARRKPTRRVALDSRDWRGRKKAVRFKNDRRPVYPTSAFPCPFSDHHLSLCPFRKRSLLRLNTQTAIKTTSMV